MDERMSRTLAARQRVREATRALVEEGAAITAAAVGARARVDGAFLYGQPDLLAEVRALRALRRSGREIDVAALDELRRDGIEREREMLRAARGAIDQLYREREVIDCRRVAHRARVGVALV